jgi:outer membrane protein OmpA-like peptidoglycan-associated protein
MQFRFAIHIALCTITTAVAIFAQQDAAGSKDHPLVSRMPDSHISDYKQQFDAFEFPISATEKTELEGTVTNILYLYNSAEKQPSPLQVLRNYQNALKGAGGTVLFERRADDGGETTIKLNRDGREIWVYVSPSVYCAPTQCYRLVVLEREAMVQEVTAGQMLTALNKDGFIALDIHFDTGKWDVTPQAQPIVGEIVTLLKQNPALRLSIEGHTDNVGTPAANKVLSANRAGSVMAAISAQGIAAARLTSAGFGDTKPVADNRSEEGRARNRRVELVKQP